MPEPNGAGARAGIDLDHHAQAFADAAVAAQRLVEQLEAYEAAVAQLKAIRDDAASLHASVRQVGNASQHLADVTGGTAEAFGAIAAAAPALEQQLQALGRTVDEAATKTATPAALAGDTIGAAVTAASSAARHAIEESSEVALRGLEQALQAHVARLQTLEKDHTDRVTARTTTSVADVAAALEAVRIASSELRDEVAEGILREGQRLREALSRSADDVPAVTAEALDAFRRELEAFADRARRQATAVAADLGSVVEDLKATAAANRTAVQALVPEFREALERMEAERRRAQAAELRRLRWLGGGVAAGIIVIIILLLLRQGPPAAAMGVPLSEATVQVLNGADPNAPLAGRMVARLRGAGVAGHVPDGLDAASSGYAHSLVLVHGASWEAALALADQVGIPHDRVLAGTPTPMNGHLTVVIGADHAAALRRAMP